MIPESGHVMVALLDDDPIIRNQLLVSSVDGFDLSDFNKITPSKHIISSRESPSLLSDSQVAFSLDFNNMKIIDKQSYVLEFTALKDGLCLGLIQWLKVRVYEDINYENMPGMTKSHWPHPIFLFDYPVKLTTGEKLLVKASLYNDKIWFSHIN